MADVKPDYVRDSMRRQIARIFKAWDDMSAFSKLIKDLKAQLEKEEDLVKRAELQSKIESTENIAAKLQKSLWE